MKTKIYIYIISLLVGGLVLNGCSDAFLEQTPNGSISFEDIQKETEKDPEFIKGLVNGMYLTMFRGEVGGTNNHDDFGQKSIDIATDLMAGNVALVKPNYGWFTYASNLSGHLYTNNATYKVWRYYYRLIKSANDVLAVYGKDETVVPENETAVSYWAQAKAIRAYAYYNLAIIYAGNYQESKNIPVLPTYIVENKDIPQPLSTLEEVMTGAMKDLEDAITIFEAIEFARGASFEIDADIAKGILAYIKLYVGEYAEAASLSEELINAYPIMDRDEILESGFADAAKIPAFIWAVDVTIENSGGLMGFWGQMDIYTYSYAFAGAVKAIDNALFAEIPNADIRKKWFFNNPQHGYNLAPYNKFFSPVAKKKGELGGDRTWLNDLCFMRTEEMCLVNAEANLQNNQPGKAKDALEVLLTERYSEESFADMKNTLTAMSDADLMDNIYFNWKLEMWGEGKTLAAMKRLQKSVTRGTNHYTLNGRTINYNDPRLTYEIPEVEQVNNPNLHK